MDALEVFRVRRGRAYLFERHMERARCTCAALGYDPPNEATIRAELSALNDSRDWRVRVIFARHTHRIEVRERVAPCGSFALDFQRGFAAAFPPHKVTDYSESTRHLSAARAAGFDEVLLHDGTHLVECATANFGLIRDRRLVLCASKEALPGITEARLSELVAGAGFSWERRQVEVRELSAFDGAIVASAIRGVVPVERVTEFDFSRGLELAESFSALLQADVERVLSDGSSPAEALTD